MKEDDNDDPFVVSRSCSKRRNVRSCVRNLDPHVYKDSVSLTPDQKRGLKRKSRSPEDDPIYSEVDDADELSDSTKKVPGYRCSPHLIPELMSKLSEKQRGWVKNIGWDSLQDMVESRMPKSLTMWLVDRVDTTSGTLDVGGTPVDIRDAVTRILKLPCGKLNVPPPLNGRSKAKLPRGVANSLEKKYSVNGRGTSAKDETKHILAEQEDEEEFCRSFVMLVLCIYAAPTTSLNINRNYLPSLLDVSKIPLMDWCGFIAQYLIQGIREFKDSTASHAQVTGCVHILHLMYIDALIKLKALILPESLTLPEVEPRIHCIGTQHLQILASLDVKYRSKDHIEYGALIESLKSGLGTANTSHFLSGGIKAVKSSSADQVSSKSARNNINGKDYAAGLIGSLIQKLKLSREEIIKDFNSRIELSDISIFQKLKISREEIIKDFNRKIELSDMSILEEFNLKFMEISLSASKKPATDDTAKDLSPGSYKEGEKTSTAKSQIAELEPIADGTEGVADVNQCPLHEKDPGLVTTPFQHPAGTKTHVTEGNVVSCADDKLFLPSSEIIIRPEQNSLSNCQDSPVTEKLCEPIPIMQREIIQSTSNLVISSKVTDDHVNVSPVNTSSAAAPDSTFETSKQKNTDCPTKFRDCMDDVVDIAIEVASQVSINQEVQANLNGNIAPLCMLSEAAYLQGSPMYDGSPVAHRNTDDQIFSHAGLESCRHSLSVISLFAKVPRSQAFPVLDDDLHGPAKFDSYPATPPERLSFDNPTACSALPAIFEDPIVEELCKSSSHIPQQDVVNETPPTGKSLVIYSPRNIHRNASSRSVSSEGTEFSKSVNTESDEKTSSDEDTPVKNDAPCSSDGIPSAFSEDYLLSQNFTNNTQELIEIPDDVHIPPNDIIHIPPLQHQLPGGVRFNLGGSVSLQTSKMFRKLLQIEKNDTTQVDSGKFSYVLSTDATETYTIHVTNSSGRTSSSQRNKFCINRARTKIQIKGFHVTVGEFVDALSPKGQVCQNLMGLCSVAIMCDWESRKKIILDQATIDGLMKEGHVCNHEVIAARLRKLPLEEIEQIYLPILSGKHWILAVVDFLKEIVEFYDSLLVVEEGSHPHRKLWENLASNLEYAYSKAKKRTVDIFFLKCVYRRGALQKNNYDCGFRVIQTIESHNKVDVVGYRKKKTMMSYRRYLSHVLVFHRFNDVNPSRPDLRQQIPWS